MAAMLLSFTSAHAIPQPLSSGNKLLKNPPAITYTENMIFPISQGVYIPCADGGAGEFVMLEGNLHVLFHITINGNNVSVKSHAQPQGISGTGMTTGDKYQGTGVTQSQFKGSLQNGQFQFSSINNFRIIGQGPGNNFLVHSTFHITANANGIITAVADNFSVDCK
jgi:hypothetical protein